MRATFLASAVIAAFLSTTCLSQTEQVLYSFQGSSDGSEPVGGVTVRGSNLYGTTSFGGAVGFGTVFQLHRTATGWLKQVLYNFTGASDGGFPSARVIFDTSGNLYGVTSSGGATSANGCAPSGCGVVFELQFSGGRWHEEVIHSFISSDGSGPGSDLIFDNKGNLYGTTAGGGNASCFGGCGTVFQLARSGGGWTFSSLYAFSGGADGASPLGGQLAIDASGNLYGTTSSQGDAACNCGTVFELSPSGGSWQENTLYRFTGGPDGAYPDAHVRFRGGSIFGSTCCGGAHGAGVVFQLRSLGGAWIERPIYTFLDGSDGSSPGFQITFDPTGNIYGMTLTGGNTGCGFPSSCGTVYKLTSSSGRWSKTTLYSFMPNGGDAHSPAGSVTLDSVGNIYGATDEGGTTNNGAIFEITP
jgi:uncharacterized repeat protein (TIGR03803 family)